MPTTERHPVTDVELNVTWIERETLNLAEATTAWVMLRQGEKLHEIAARLGTSPQQLREIFAERVHPEAKALADKELSPPAWT